MKAAAIRRAPLGGLLMMLLAPAMAGCVAIAPPVTGTLASAVETATVTMGSVDAVLVLSGEIRSHAEYTVTAPQSGTVFLSPENQLFVVTSDGLHVLVAPVAGTESLEPLVATDGSFVATVGLPIATATYSGFVMSAEVTSSNILRIEEPPVEIRAQVEGGAGPFACSLLDAYPSRDSADGAKFRYACAIPDSERVIDGMPGKLAIVLKRETDVLTLPIEAIAGSIDSGSVEVRDGETSKIVSVRLGASDGNNIVIESGLSEGQVVSIPDPGLLNGR